MKNWKTTTAGIILGILGGMQMYGVHIGHVGSGDYLGLIQTILGVTLGVAATDPKSGNPPTGGAA